MPKTKFQNFIFILMTAVLMTYCMIVYSVAINSPEGLINQIFFVGPLVRNGFKIIFKKQLQQV